MTKGSCLCGAVTFAFDGKTTQIGMCHCSKCRKVSGVASNATLMVPRDNLNWLSGADAINIRAGMANSAGSAADRFLAIAYQRKMRFVVLGIGVADTRIASDLFGPGRDNALDSEVYFRVPVFDNAGHITPSIQYVEVPSVDATDPLSGSSAIVAGVRFHWSF